MAAAAVTFAVVAIVGSVAAPQENEGDEDQQKKDDDFVHRFRRGQRYFGTGDDKKAEAIFRELIAEKPEEGALHHALGSVLQFEKKPEDAAREFLIAARLSPEEAVIQRDTGQQLVALGRAPEAIPYLARAYRLWPDEIETCVAYGTALRLTGDSAGAEAVYVRAHAVDAESVDVAVGLAACVVRRDPQRALQLVEKATGAWADVAYVRGLALEKLERYEDAVLELKRVLQLAPPGAAGILFLRDASESLLRCGAIDVALVGVTRWFDAEKASGAASPAACSRLAEVRAAAGDLAGALDALAAASTLEEDSAELRAQVKLLRAGLLVSLRRADEARGLLESMTAFAPERFERAAALRLLGRLPAAEFAARAKEPDRANDVEWVEMLAAAMAGDETQVSLHLRRASELSHPRGEFPGLLVMPPVVTTPVATPAPAPK